MFPNSVPRVSEKQIKQKVGRGGLRGSSTDSLPRVTCVGCVRACVCVCTSMCVVCVHMRGLVCACVCTRTEEGRPSFHLWVDVVGIGCGGSLSGDPLLVFCTWESTFIGARAPPDFRTQSLENEEQQL